MGVGDEIQEENKVNTLVAGRIGGSGRMVGSAGDRGVAQKFADAKDAARGRTLAAAAPGKAANANAAEQQSSQTSAKKTVGGAGGEKPSESKDGGSGSAQDDANKAEATAGANPLA